MEDIRHVRDMIRQEPVLASLRRQSFRAEGRPARITQFENKAEELRAVAEDVILNDTKLMLLRLAENYERVAATLRSCTSPQ